MLANAHSKGVEKPSAGPRAVLPNPGRTVGEAAPIRGLRRFDVAFTAADIALAHRPGHQREPERCPAPDERRHRCMRAPVRPSRGDHGEGTPIEGGYARAAAG